MSQLLVSDICKHYNSEAGAVDVLKGAQFSASDGDTVAILGPSGSGKSTLLNIIGTLDSPDSGEVVCDGINVIGLTGVQLADFRSKRVGFVFQDHHLLPQLTIAENIMLPTIPADTSQGAYERVISLLQRMGIESKADSLPSKLSGGERQRVAVARALINNPELLLCDEPTGSLDTETGASIISLLIELAAEKNVIVIVVTHNLDQAARLSRRLLLKNGRLIEES